jgi:phage terminase large subunit-like protein
MTLPLRSLTSKSLSCADSFNAMMPVAEGQQFLANLTEKAAYHLKYDWSWFSRPEQQLPVVVPPFVTWLILAGRGWGKTRTGAETVREWVKTNKYVNLIGATLDDARDIMIEGESGILAICPRDERPRYVGRKLLWPNGAKSLIFTADEPDRLRGKQHMKFWADELCAWRYAESWDQANLGLRIGTSPQCVVTTTPKPTKELKALVVDPTTYVTKGFTDDNYHNLSPVFINKIISKYRGTRLGRQELDAEILDDNPGALWKRKQIDDLRVKAHPDLKRIVIAIDPAATSNPDSDETGIVAAGLGVDNHGYILDDLTLRGTPEEWAQCAVTNYHRLRADRIIGETNNGGEMVETVIRMKDRNVPFTAVHASRGKITRAEPISALYEQGKVHHVGYFPQLEDQMCDYDPKTAKYSPDRMDALVWALTELMAEISVGDTAIEVLRILAERRALEQQRR